MTDEIEAALTQAREAVSSGTVGIAGGADAVRQFLSAGLIDELPLHIAPVVIGAGERRFDGVGQLSLEPLEVSGNDLVTRVKYRLGH